MAAAASLSASTGRHDTVVGGCSCSYAPSRAARPVRARCVPLTLRRGARTTRAALQRDDRGGVGWADAPDTPVLGGGGGGGDGEQNDVQGGGLAQSVLGRGADGETQLLEEGGWEGGELQRERCYLVGVQLKAASKRHGYSVLESLEELGRWVVWVHVGGVGMVVAALRVREEAKGGPRRSRVRAPHRRSLARRSRARLADTAGLEVVGQTHQMLEEPNPRTYIGSGKVSEIVAAVGATGADSVIFDDELSPGERSAPASFLIVRNLRGLAAASQPAGSAFPGACPALPSTPRPNPSSTRRPAAQPGARAGGARAHRRPHRFDPGHLLPARRHARGQAAGARPSARRPGGWVPVVPLRARIHATERASEPLPTSLPAPPPRMHRWSWRRASTSCPASRACGPTSSARAGRGRSRAWVSDRGGCGLLLLAAAAAGLAPVSSTHAWLVLGGRRLA